MRRLEREPEGLLDVCRWAVQQAELVFYYVKRDRYLTKRRDSLIEGVLLGDINI